MKIIEELKEELLKYLDSETAEKFIKNALNPEIRGIFRTQEDILGRIKSNGFSSCLFAAFDWVASEEKGPFWFTIYKDLRKH